jgi:putative ABC transport system substrate-binding protein
MIGRRTFIAGLGSAATCPLAAWAQQPVIGFLGAQSGENSKGFIVRFLQSLKEAGYVEGQTVMVEYRYAENEFDRLPALAADLVRRRVAVIIAGSTPAALAAKAATTTIPIVFSVGADPVAMGLVASLNRPGANVTGTANLIAELAPKQLQLLRQLIPNAAVFALLADPAAPGARSTIAPLQGAARTMGLQLIVVNARTASDLETAFATLSQRRVGAVLVSASTLYNRRPEQLPALAAGHTLPAIFVIREYALAGGLMSYGSSAGYLLHEGRGGATGAIPRAWTCASEA